MNPADRTGVRERDTGESYGRSLLNRVLTEAAAGGDPLTHVAELPARHARTTAWPEWVPSDLVTALDAQEITLPWEHQTRTADFAATGNHVVVSTGTASGKSLGYQLPVLTALLDDPRATALYLSPTKALGADQLRKNVTSPNGTTYAALQVLMADDGLKPLMEKAIAAAAKRSQELAS